MRLRILLFLFIASAGLAQAQSQGGTGLGIIIGNPTGISLKVWPGGNMAFDAAAAWSFSGKGYLQVHGDFLFHNYNLLDPQFPVYYGVGAVVGISSDIVLGARVPVGITHLFSGAPLDVFLEVVPRLNLIPNTNFNVDAAIGVRYYFGRPAQPSGRD